MDNIPTDILGSVIKFVKQEDIFNLAKTNKQLYKAALLHYLFDDYKLLLKLSDEDFSTILKNVNVDPEVIFKAIISGNKHQLLKKYTNKIDPSLDNNWAIKYASKKGYYKIVKLLLELPLKRGVDPSADGNNSIIYASGNGHTSVVKLLLDLPVERGVDPSVDDNTPLLYASDNDHASVVKLLLNLPVEKGIDPSVNNNWAIIHASENGFEAVVKLLLDLPVERGIDPSVYNNWIIKESSENGHVSVVKLLANSPNISLSNIPDLKILDIIIKNYLKK